MEDQNVTTNNPTPSTNSPNNVLTPIPNSTTILVLGIISIPTCCSGIVGLILGIIALSLGGKSLKLYNANPGIYTASSLSNLKAGKICAIIGLILSTLMFIYYIINFLILGAAMTAIPWMQMFDNM